MWALFEQVEAHIPVELELLEHRVSTAMPLVSEFALGIVLKYVVRFMKVQAGAYSTRQAFYWPHKGHRRFYLISFFIV